MSSNIKTVVLTSVFANWVSLFAMASPSLFRNPLPKPKSKNPTHPHIELIVNQIPYFAGPRYVRVNGTRIKEIPIAMGFKTLNPRRLLIILAQRDCLGVIKLVSTLNEIKISF